MAYAPGAKIADTVLLSAADKDKQELYGPLALESAGDDAPAPEDSSVPGSGATIPEDFRGQQVVLGEKDIAESERADYVRAVLGDKQYERTYTVFGQVKIVMQERTAGQTEALYAELDAASIRDEIHVGTEGQWIAWVERLQLASTLRSITQYGLDKKDYPPTDKLLARARALLDLNMPLFNAAMQVSRDFETRVRVLAEHATDPDFWPAGGPASQPAPQPPAPSTSQARPRANTGA